MMLVAGAVAVLFALVLLPLLGWQKWVFGAVLLLASLPSVRLWWAGPDSPIELQSVAPAYVAITGLSLVLLASIVFLPAGESVSNAAWRVLPLVAYLGIGLVVWPISQVVTSGILHILTCALAFLIGMRLAGFLDPNSPNAVYATMVLLGITLVFLTIPSLYQFANGTGVDGYGTRTGAVFGHPSTVGKVATVFICVSLPLVTSKSRVVAHGAIWTIGAATFATLPTLSRANLGAIALVLAGWVILNARERGTGKVVLGSAIGVVVALPFINALIDRFLSDPEGNERPLLLEAALRQLPNFWIFGTGPNNYTTVMRESESITASTGYPVHNAPLLVMSEIGVLGIVALLPVIVPVLVAAARSFSASTRHSARLHGRALLLLIVGVGFIGWTGWGIVRAPTAQLVCFLLATQLQLALATHSRRLIKPPTDSSVDLLSPSRQIDDLEDLAIGQTGSPA